MKIIVEVGSSEERELINSELQSFFGATSEIFPTLTIDRIIVPADFDIAVNGLLEKPNCQSVRNLGEHQVRAQAKIINSPAGFCIVLSFRLFYSEHEDIQTRAFVYIHELIHLVNSSKFLVEEIYSQSDRIYVKNLERFVDEYIADRKAYAVIDKLFLVKSELWEAALIRQASSFIIALTDQNHKQEIKESIQQLQAH